MSLTISKQLDNGILYANSDLLVELTSTKTSEPNFAVVLDIKDENNNLIVRTKQRKGLNNTLVFNLNNIIYNSMELNVVPNIDSNTNSYVGINSEWLNKYKVLFGEEYSSSPSSSVLLYNGNTDTEGQPAKIMTTAENGLHYFSAGTKEREYNPITNIYNKYVNHFAPSSIDARLTSHPTTYDTNTGDTLSITLPNGGASYIVKDIIYNDIAVMKREYYDEYDLQGNLIDTEYIPYVNRAGYTTGNPVIRTNTNQNYTTISSDFYSTDYTARLTQVVIQDITRDTIPTSSKSYRVRVYGSGSDESYNYGIHTGELDNSLTYADITINLNKYECINPSLETYRLVWINEYGALDYFSFEGQNTKNLEIERTNIKTTPIKWDSANTSNAIASTRGNQQIQSKFTTKFTASTRFLTQEYADWLESLFVSPAVWLITGNFQYTPIVITSANYRSYTNQKQDKLKSYTIEFELSNDKRTR